MSFALALHGGAGASRTLNYDEIRGDLRSLIEHGRNGLLVDFFDHGRLADTIIDALARPQAHRALRSQARADVLARYDLRKIALPRWIDLIDSMVA